MSSNANASRPPSSYGLERRKGQPATCSLSNLFLVLLGLVAGILVGFNMVVDHWGSEMQDIQTSAIFNHLRKSFVTRQEDKSPTINESVESSDWIRERKRIKNEFAQRTKDALAPEEEEVDDSKRTGVNPQEIQLPAENHANAQQTHEIAGLSCRAYGGPSDEFAQKEMVYWQDIKTDSLYESPFRKHHRMEDKEPKYMTFEPDGGGWNNIRMALETVVALAHAMGRTLVLPPEQGFYLLRKDREKNKINFSFNDFFHMESLSREHKGLDIITMDEFLKREALAGNLRNITTGQVSFPPGNETDWNGKDVNPLKDYLRNVTYWRNWRVGECMAAFPTRAGHDDVKKLQDMMENIIDTGGTPLPDFYKDKPTPVDAPGIDRLRENLAGRRELCVYDEEMQSARVVHFLCYHKIRARLLTHFYTFLFFEDWKQDLFYKRFMRDHFRYLDEIQCAAARVVEAIRKRARERDTQGNPNGDFDSFHVRRGDFQFKHTRVDADVLYENSADKLSKGATLFIATDERKKEFFKPLTEYYDVVYLDDFKDLIKGINTNYYGMLDQLIAARGRVFFGTWHSTFTGYINRIRGYFVTRDKLPGYEMGTMESYYFVPLQQKDAMKHYIPVNGAHFNREFPVAWRDIDRGIHEIHQNAFASE